MFLQIVIVRHLLPTGSFIADLLSTAQFVVEIVLVVVIVVHIVDFHVDFDHIAHLVGLERHDIKKVAVGFVDTHHSLGKARGIQLSDLILQFGCEVVEARHQMFFSCFFSHIG